MIATDAVTTPLRSAAHWSEFRKIWAGWSVSLMGSQVTTLALPLTAALTLGAGPFEMGLLAAASQAPFLLFSLLAGVWSDRVRRRPLLIATDLGQAALLATIPVAAAFGVLSLIQLYLVAFLTGTLVVFNEVAQYAYVPALVGRDQIVAANSRIQVSHSAAESAGPGLAGLLVQAISAPIAILIDACSFVVSAVCLRAVRTPEAPPARPAGGSIRAQASEGLRALLGHPLLRPIVLASVTISLFDSAIVALYVLYALCELHLSPIVIGLIFAAGGFAAIPGALLASKAAERIGVGSSIVGGWFVQTGARLLIPLAMGPLAIPFLVLSQLTSTSSGTVANIHQWSLRQVVTPDHLLGRVTASHRFIVYGIEAVGALLGGLLGGLLGLRMAIAICAICATLGPLWAVWSPLRRLRTQPAAA
jgi:MFS family permease